MNPSDDLATDGGTPSSAIGRVDWDGEQYEIVAESETHLTLRLDRDTSQAEREFGRSKPIRLHKRLAERWETTDELSFSVDRADQDLVTDGGTDTSGTYRVDCRDCDWSETFDDEQLAKDQQVEHELTNGHATDQETVQTDGGTETGGTEHCDHERGRAIGGGEDENGRYRTHECPDCGAFWDCYIDAATADSTEGSTHD